METSSQDYHHTLPSGDLLEDGVKLRSRAAHHRIWKGRINKVGGGHVLNNSALFQPRTKSEAAGSLPFKCGKERLGRTAIRLRCNHSLPL